MDLMILHRLEDLSLEEKREVAERLRALIAEDVADRASAGDPGRCPRCGSADLARKGHGRDGSQRWRCGSCGRTFSARTGSVLAASKLPAATWADYVEGTLAGESLRALARRCGVCPGTSWFMRMRLLEVMGAALQPFRCGPTVSCQVDGTYVNESLSGSRARSARGMPRRAHRNGQGVRRRGVSRDKVCVVCAANDVGDGFAAVCGRGRPTDAGLRGSLAGIVDGSWVSTDDHTSYARVLPRLGVAEHVPTASGAAGNGELGLVNAMHQWLKIFLEPFHGVSTRWLQRYLDFFCWLEQARRSDADGRDTLSGQVACGSYSHTRRDLIEMPQPLWDRWEAEG
ncbi:IS1595 family transposase [Olsenella sp. Marseille-P4559]|uniref:IS1595 family transposase n=1 Tax=Olsenella sp. Marseille-P4559 TaxID=2364795 RepID=UPI0010324FCD|nr:IS1595 family transposase [Olsenella sp. Marseille-P4559]